MAALPGPRAGTGVSAARSGRARSDTLRTSTARTIRVDAGFMPSTPFHFFEFRGHQRVNEFLHVATEHGDLAHQRRRNEGELLLRREEHGLKVAHEMS